MRIKNIMEDVVYSTVEAVLLKETETENSKELVEDICAFVLNRIPPHYITSERGILHGMLDSKFLLQQKTDILLLIHEALDVIKQRRGNESSHFELKEQVRTCYFPHIIGEVVEESTFSKIDGVSVTLLYQKEPAMMISKSWENPFITNRGTMSYYHFWPDFDEEPEAYKEYEFTLVFEHEMFESKTYAFSVTPVRAMDMTASRTIPVMLLALREGADSSFLYKA